MANVSLHSILNEMVSNLTESYTGDPAVDAAVERRQADEFARTGDFLQNVGNNVVDGARKITTTTLRGIGDVSQNAWDGVKKAVSPETAREEALKSPETLGVGSGYSQADIHPEYARNNGLEDPSWWDGLSATQKALALGIPAALASGAGVLALRRKLAAQKRGQ